MRPYYSHLALILLGMGVLGAGCAPLDDTADRTCTAINDVEETAALGIGAPNPTDGMVAQAFTARESATFTDVKVSLIAVVPANTSQGFSLTMSIQTDLGGTTATTPSIPSGASLASQTMSVASMGLSTDSYKEISFALAPVAVTAAQIYWIILSTSAASSTNYVAWGGSASDAYTEGKALSYNTAFFNWTTNVLPSGADFKFKVNCR